jgi:6-phosphofructokinase 2
MIYTVTLNPCLDITVEVEELVYDDVNYIAEERKRAGGKGIDVSRVIKELGGQSVALGFAGGYHGMELEGSLINEGVVCDFTKMHEETKTNITIYQRKKKIQTLLSTPEPSITPLEMAAFFGKIREIPAGSFVAISGNPPESINENFYAQITTTLREKGIKVVLDTDGVALKMGVSAGPFLIKPNIHEFGRLVEKNVSDMNEILEQARPYMDVLECMVVSMGVKGVLGLTKEGVFRVVPPKVKVRSSIGAGDSLVAGIVYGLSSGSSFEDAVVLGVACGTASTLNQENGLCRKEDVLEIQKDIVVKKI